MPTKEEINEQLSRLGMVRAFGAKREIAALPDILGPDENILGMITGTVESVAWFVLCTNRRVLFLDQGVNELKQNEIKLDDIYSVELQCSQATCRIVFTAYDDTTLTLCLISRKSARLFLAAVEQARA